MGKRQRIYNGSPYTGFEKEYSDGERAHVSPFTLPRSTVWVIDEAGCSEPSHGVVYLAEKHGYEGPMEIPWPASPEATATLP
jgi:hypothetical protein